MIVCVRMSVSVSVLFVLYYKIMMILLILLISLSLHILLDHVEKFHLSWRVSCVSVCVWRENQKAYIRTLSS